MTTSRKPATKRATAARKPAKRAAPKPVNGQATNGQTNGQTEVRPPEQFIYRDETTAPVEPTLKVPEVEHPYGDRAVQVFEFDSAPGGPIVVPHISAVNVTELFLWENERRGLDLMRQSWRWLDLAGIPEDIQARIIGLAPMEKRRFWNEWFSGFTPPPTGEPPGES